MSGEAEDVPWLRLERWEGTWADDDEFAGLKADVAAYGHADPLATLTTLSEHTGVPVGALVRYVLARWASGGAEALLELGTSGVTQLRRVVEEAERAGTEEARLAAFDVLRQQVSWLAQGLVDPEAAYPGGGGGARRYLRLGVYAVITDEAGRLLLTRLAPGREDEGRWTLPGGGLDHGEAPRVGVRREIHEETGLDAHVGALIDVDDQHVPPHRTPNGVDAHRVRLLFHAEVDTSVPPRVVEVGGSTDAVRWVTSAELASLPLGSLARHGARLAGLGEALGAGDGVPPPP